MDITTIILTYNEELHIKRCIENAFKFSKEVFVIDSFSSDRTCDIAKEMGASVVQHEFINQAQQFQWAIDNCEIKTGWTLRLDADEYLTEELISELDEKLPALPEDVTGCYMLRRVVFMGKVLKYGILRKVRLLRIWRTGCARMEQRWIDEHIVLTKGQSFCLRHLLLDHNLKGLDDFIIKHNNYSNREAFIEINRIYNLIEEKESTELKGRNKQKSFYYKLPRFFRAYLYFFVRYVVFLGFLDGRRGFIWLKLQAYWYRLLVDSKLYEMEKKLGKHPSKEDVKAYVQKYWGINIFIV